MESNNASETQEKKIPRNKTKDIVQANTKGSIESLPQEIMLYIFSKLPLSSMPQFMYVNKDWCRISRDTNFFDVCKDCYDEISHCLIFQSDRPVKNEIYMVEFDAVYNDEDTNEMRFRSMFPFPMLENEVNCSFNGLLCVSKTVDYGIFLYNLFTMEYIELPKPTHESFEQYSEVVGFGFHPKTNEYKEFILTRSSSIQFENLLVENFGWKFITPSPGQQISTGSYRWKVTLPNNRFMVGRKIISFDLDDEKFRVVPKSRALVLRFSDYVLLSLNGYLAAALCGNDPNWETRGMGYEGIWCDELLGQGFHHCKIRAQANWEFLIRCRGRALVVYDPKTESFKDVEFKGMRKWFDMVVHVANFNRIHAILGI